MRRSHLAKEGRRQARERAKFAQEEREMEQRNLEKRTLAGAKAMYPMYTLGNDWDKADDQLKKIYLAMARACIEAADHTTIEV